MKRMLGCFTAILMLFSGCNSMPLRDEIRLTPLREDQQQIVKMISGQDKVFLFDYHTNKSYRYAKIWADIYQDGELVEPGAAEIELPVENAQGCKGQFSISIRTTPGYQWMFSISDSDSGISSILIPVEIYPENSSYIEGSLNQSEEIVAGKEIFLCGRMFSDGNKGLRFYGGKQYLENPELLKEYSYAHVIKCCFYNEQPNV